MSNRDRRQTSTLVEQQKNREVQTSGRASAPLPENTEAAVPPPVALEVGQRVSYNGDQYTVEALTDRHIDLFDERNGSRITFASSDFAAIRLFGQRA